MSKRTILITIIVIMICTGLITIMYLIFHDPPKKEKSTRAENTSEQITTEITETTTEDTQEEDIIATGGSDEKKDPIIATMGDSVRKYREESYEISEDGDAVTVTGVKGEDVGSLNGYPDVTGYSCKITGLNILKKYIPDISLRDIHYNIYLYCYENSLTLPEDIEFYQADELKDYNSIQGLGKMLYKNADYIPITLTYKDGFYRIYPLEEEPHDNE